MRETIYLKHPLSAADKAKYVAQGYKIMDAKFAPAGAKIGGQKVEPVAEVIVAEPVVELTATDEPEIVIEAEKPKRSYRRRKKG